MKIYLSGPIRGVKDHNLPAFRAMREQIRAKGHIVFCPGEMSAANGYPPNYLDDPHPNLAEEHRELARGLLRHVMLTDIAAIYAADAVAVLPGWWNSRGATVEVALGQFLGLPILEADTLAPIDKRYVPLCPWRYAHDFTTLPEAADALHL